MFNHTFLRNVLVLSFFCFPHQVRDAIIVIRAFRFWRTCFFFFFFLWCRPKEHASDVAVQYKVVCVNILFVFVEHGLFIFRSLPRSFLPIYLSIWCTFVQRAEPVLLVIFFRSFHSKNNSLKLTKKKRPYEMLSSELAGWKDNAKHTFFTDLKLATYVQRASVFVHRHSLFMLNK